MKEGWKYIGFKDVFPIKMGKTPPRGDAASWDLKKESRNKWVSIADISSNEGKVINDTKEYISDSAAKKIFKVPKGSLLMSFKLSIGRMAFAGDDLYTNEAIIAIPESDKYLLRFLFYYLSSYNWLSLTEGNEKVKGATLNKTSIGSIQLPVLSLSQQQEIVDSLDSSFSKIDAMMANAEKSLDEAKALFQSSLKELLEPKEGWKVKRLEEVCDFRSGFAFKSNLFTKTGEPIIRISEIQNEKINISNLVFFDLSSYKEDLSKYIVLPNDILIAMSGGTTGKIGINTTNRHFYLNQRVGLFREDVKYLNHKYLFYYLLTKSEESLRIAEGAAQPNLSTAQIKSFMIPILSLEEQQSIANTLDSIKSKVDQLQVNYDKISQECDALKQSILKQVFE